MSALTNFIEPSLYIVLHNDDKEKFCEELLARCIKRDRTGEFLIKEYLDKLHDMYSEYCKLPNRIKWDNL